MKFQDQNPVRAVAKADYAATDAVVVNFDAIRQLPKSIEVSAMGPALSEACPFSEDVAAFVPYFIAMDTMNYQFWDLKDGVFTRYSKDGLVGALAMQKSFEDVWTQAAGSTSKDQARMLADMVSMLRERVRVEGVASIFGNIPAAESRRDILLEVLDPVKLPTVSEYLSNRVLNDRELDHGDAQLLAARFPLAYGDRYLKKAQLTLMFIAAQRNAAPFLPVENRCIVEASACADYQLPKVLRSLGLVSYKPKLAALVDGQSLIEPDSLYERAIRAATVIACDALADHFGTDVAAVDFWLWVNRNQARNAQFHLTQTTAY